MNRQRDTGGGHELDGDSPIESYLDALVVESAGHDPRELRHLLAEAEAHLRDDAEHLRMGGVPAYRSEAQAVARFGPARDVARADRERLRPPVASLARQVLSTGLRLGGVGGVAVGVSGVVALVFRVIGGARFLVDSAPGQVLAAGDCARWMAADPGAHSCRDAAVADWVGEIVGYRLAAGLVGVLCLLAYRGLRRRGDRAPGWAGLPGPVGNTVAVTLFAAGGLWTLGAGVDAIVVASGHGAGQWLSAAPVALVAAVLFGGRLLRDLRAPAA